MVSLSFLSYRLTLTISMGKHSVVEAQNIKLLNIQLKSCDLLFAWIELDQAKRHVRPLHCTKMEFSIKDFFSKYDQIRSFLRIWSHLLKKSLMENFIFSVVLDPAIKQSFAYNLVGISK